MDQAERNQFVADWLYNFLEKGEISAFYISPKKAAKMLDCAESTLANDRANHRGLNYSKANRSVRYSIADIFTYMEKHKVEVE